MKKSVPKNIYVYIIEKAISIKSLLTHFDREKVTCKILYLIYLFIIAIENR